jgi:hypothetical protein
MLMNHASDMANIDLGWEVDGIMTPQESVSAMIKVIESKGIQHSGTFWTWENKVCDSDDLPGRLPDSCSNIPGKTHGSLYIICDHQQELFLQVLGPGSEHIIKTNGSATEGMRHWMWRLMDMSQSECI